jgi:hypothetical protein
MLVKLKNYILSLLVKSKTSKKAELFKVPVKDSINYTFVSYFELPEEEEYASRKIREELADFGDKFRKLGIEDGKSCKRKQGIREIIESHIEGIRNHIKATFRGRHEAAKIDKQTKKSKYDNENELNTIYHNHFNLLLDYCHRYPKHHSFTIFLMYLFVALFLILADIPLALKLIEQGFNLDGPDEAKGEAHLMISQLFNNPLGVFAANWETFLLSIGIALCAVYVKILYDDFFGDPIHMVATRFKKIPGVDDDKDITALRKAFVTRKAVKFIIFLFTIATIILLGYFRYHTIQSGSNTVTKEGFITLYTLIAITLIFPVIGGVCFSLSLSNIQNINRLKKAKKNADIQHKKYLKALKEYTHAETKEHSLKSFLVDWTEENFVSKNYKKFLLGQYLHGYEEGLRQFADKDESNSLIEKVKIYRKKVLANKIYRNIIEDNDDFPPIIEIH